MTLAGQLGIRLVIWTGGAVPRPAPHEVLAALTRLRVVNSVDSWDGFEMTFSLGREEGVDFTLLRSGALKPFSRVVIGVAVGVVPEVLVNGVITHHEIDPGDEPGTATLTVKGRDTGLLLDLEERNEEYPNQPDHLIVTRLLLAHGLAPQVTPTTDVPLELFRIPRQHETDLRFIERLAGRNGFVFYVEPLAFGVNTGYWGPETRLGTPQPALAANMGPATNVRGLSFAEDGLAPVGAAGTFTEPITKTDIPIPPLPTLKVPPVAANPTPVRRTVLLRDTANANPAQAATAALATTMRSPDAVTGRAEVDTARYGGVLRARRLVGVQGAGLSYDGLYYVREVTHTIARGAYTQQCSLSREGTRSLTPVVPR